MSSRKRVVGGREARVSNLSRQRCNTRFKDIATVLVQTSMYARTARVKPQDGPHRDTHQQVSTCTQGLRFYVPDLLHLVRANSPDAGLSTRFCSLVCENHQILLRAPEKYIIQILLQVVDYVFGRLEFDVGLASNQSSSSL